MIETGAIEDSKTIVAVYYWQAQTLAQKLKENHE